MNIEDICLVKTCVACPEQYDAFSKHGVKVGYLRLRWGWFTVVCPDVGGQLVYSAAPEGGDIFEAYERELYLENAKRAIARYYSRDSDPKAEV